MAHPYAARKTQKQSSNEQHSAAANANAKLSSSDVLLNQLLPKLRPFQREAFEFATQGKTSQRLKKQSTTNTNHQHEEQQQQQEDQSSFRYDPALLGKGRILLADEMGLGKTVTSLAIMAHYRKEWPLLILCPASLRHTWPGEIEKFLPSIPPQSVYVVSGFNDVGFQHRKDVQVVVMTYSLLQTRSAVAQLLLSEKTFAHFQCVIADESHNLKQKNSQRSKIALPILKKAKRLLLLSGTPALARPVELWLQLHALAPHLFGSYTNFTKEHCDAKRKFGHWDVTGLSNAKELHLKLKQVMVRRLKCDVLQELPAKQRMIVPIKLTVDKARLQENKSILQDLSETRLSITDLVGDDQRTASFEAKQLFMQAYQASGIAKAGAVADYLVDWVAGAGTQKVLVFAHHKAVMDTLELAISKQLKGVGHIRIDGSVAANDRAKLVRKFQTNKQVRVGLLSMTAAGVGITLTAASNVMFAELHYTPGVLAQAEDRAHRIGQRNAVNIMYFVCKDETVSVDNAIWKMLGRKVGTLEQVIDGGSGKERVALSAKEVEGKSDKPRQSGQGELSTFFAETASDTHMKKQPKIPVKGSIMSFFKKASSPASASATATGSQSSLTIHGKEKNDNTDDNIEWQCQRCTFLNSRKRAAYLACEMCSLQFVQEDFLSTESDSTPRVTPRSAPRHSSPFVKTPRSVVASKPNNSNTHQTPLARAPQKSATQASASSQVVIIDDEDSSLPGSRKTDSKCKASLGDLIVIGSDDDDDEPAQRQLSPFQGPVRSISKIEPKEMLTFSVSKNSGRITLHYKEDGSSSLVNFDVHEVVTDETVDALADAQTTRANAVATSVHLQFDKEAIIGVINKLGPSKFQSRTERKQGGQELETFVSSFLALREIERKAIKESGEPVSSQNLSQAATKVMMGAVQKRQLNDNAKITDRYTGGAKERATERLNEGTATREDLALLKGDSCAWCAGMLSDASKIAKSVYCSQDCAEEGRLRRGGMYASSRIRDQVFALEGGVCQLCGIDAHALFLRIKAASRPQRLSVLCNVNWKLPVTKKSLDRLLQDPKEGSFWQADHIQAVAEGGGGCGLDNLRTLCVPCHCQETEKLRGRLKLMGGAVGGIHATKVDGDGCKRKQLDIRSIFSTAGRASSQSSSSKRKKH